MKLRIKLILGFGAVALVTGALGIFTMMTYFGVREEFSLLQEDIIPGALSMLETNAAVKSLLVEVDRIVRTGDTTHQEHASEAIANIQRNTAEHTEHETHVGEEEGQAAQAMEDRAARIISRAEQVMDAVEAGGSQAEVESLLDQMNTEAEELEAIFEEHVAEHMSELAATEKNVFQALAGGIQAVWVAIAIALVLSLGVGFYFVNTFTKPVLAVTKVARKLAVGEVNQTVEVKSRDEVGQMANAFRQIIAYLQEMAAAADRLAQGDVTAEVTPQSEKDVLGNAFTQMIAYQQQMAGAASSLAQGDVTADVTPQSDKDVLGNAFSRMITYQQQVAEAAGRLAQGDMTAEVMPQSEKDVLGNAFTQMIAYQQQMAGAASSLAQGDLTASVTPQSEKDALGSAFRQMIANLRDLIGQVQQGADQVTSSSQQMNIAAEQASQASQQVATTIQQVAGGTAQQTRSVTEATGNVEQMARAADGIARGAQEQAQGVQNTSDLIGEMASIVDQVGQVVGSVTGANAKAAEAARHGVTVVEQTGKGMDTIRIRTTTAAEKVKEMGSRSKEISRIVETIDDIADKTDMLALNAAVEAARAGEHGRGFAVVADQVRKLSEDSKGATRDIGELIERVQETVNEAVAAMESTVAEVDTGTRLAGDTAQSLQEILQAAEDAAVLAEQINSAVAQLKQKSEGVVAAVESVSTVVEENTAVAEEMAANSQEVTDTMEGVASVAEENSASTEEVSASAEEMSAQVEEVVASAEELAALAEQLRSAAAQFQLEETGRIERERPEMAGIRHPQTASALAGRQGDGYGTEVQ